MSRSCRHFSSKRGGEFCALSTCPEAMGIKHSEKERRTHSPDCLPFKKEKKKKRSACRSCKALGKGIRGRGQAREASSLHFLSKEKRTRKLTGAISSGPAQFKGISEERTQRVDTALKLGRGEGVEKKKKSEYDAKPTRWEILGKTRLGKKSSRNITPSECKGEYVHCNACLKKRKKKRENPPGRVRITRGNGDGVKKNGGPILREKAILSQKKRIQRRGEVFAPQGRGGGEGGNEKEKKKTLVTTVEKGTSGKGIETLEGGRRKGRSFCWEVKKALKGKRSRLFKKRVAKGGKVRRVTQEERRKGEYLPLIALALGRTKKRGGARREVGERKAIACFNAVSR